MDCHSGQEPRLPLTQRWSAHSLAAGSPCQGPSEPGLALQTDANRKGRAVYPELVAARRCKLVVLGAEVGGRIGQETLGFVRQLANARRAECPQDDAGCRSPTRFRDIAWSCPWRRPMSVMAPSRPWRRCWLTPGPSSPSCPAAYPRRGGREPDGMVQVQKSVQKKKNICRRKKVPGEKKMLIPS